MGTNDFNDAAKRHGRKQRDEVEDTENLIKAAEDFLDQNIIREVLSLNGALFFRGQNGKWSVCSSAKLGGHFSLCRKTKFMDAVVHVMEDRGLNYLNATYSYKQVPDDTLNLVDTSRWIQPICDQENHWIFDVLLQSLGGNKPENIEHLEHCIVHKRECPENSHHLPCILIQGEGSVGKNIIVNIVFKKLFDGQTVSTSKNNVMDKFNSIIEGMAVVLIDEGAEGFANQMKITVGNPEITIDRKNCPQFQSDNLAWYFVSSNRSDAGIWLDRSSADRRYSVLKVNESETFAYWIAMKQGLLDGKTTPEEQEAILDQVWQWQLTEGNAILSDPIEIAKWFGNLWMKHGDKGIPKALHGEDYKALLNVQEPIHERMIHAIFSDPHFTHINKSTMFKAYGYLCKDYKVSYPIRDRVLFQFVEKYITRHRLYIKEDRVFQGPKGLEENMAPRDKDKKRPRLFVSLDKKDEAKTNNDCYYVENNTWIGPELA